MFVVAIRRHEPTPDRHADEHGRRRGSLRKEVADGLRYVLGNRYLRGIAASTATSNFFSNVALGTFIVYAVRELGLTPLEIGVIFGLGNVGAVIGALLANRMAPAVRCRADDRRRHIARRPGPAAHGVGAAGIPGAIPRRRIVPPGLRDRRLQHQPAQLPTGHHPAAMQGRMNATMRFIVWGTIPLGTILGGVIATVVGLQPAILIGAIGGVPGRHPAGRHAGPDDPRHADAGRGPGGSRGRRRFEQRSASAREQDRDLLLQAPGDVGVDEPRRQVVDLITEGDQLRTSASILPGFGGRLGLGQPVQQVACRVIATQLAGAVQIADECFDAVDRHGQRVARLGRSWSLARGGRRPRSRPASRR